MTRNDIHTYIFDLDGVIYRGDEVQPTAAETIQALRSRGEKVYFLTNNSTLSRTQYSTKLTNLGIPTGPAEIMTSAYATALYLCERKPQDAAAYVVGESGLIEELESAGVAVVEHVNGRAVDFVVAGLDRRFDYQKLYEAQQAIFAGAEFIATNQDPTFPMEEGAIFPGGGSIVSAIRTASGKEPQLIGKPETYSLEKVMALSDSKPEQTIVVGDRLDTDVWVGNRAGVYTILVLTGVSSRQDAEDAPPEMKPRRIIGLLSELLK